MGLGFLYKRYFWFDINRRILCSLGGAYILGFLIQMFFHIQNGRMQVIGYQLGGEAWPGSKITIINS